MENNMFKTLELFKGINDKFGCKTIDSDWYNSYLDDINDFTKEKNDFMQFLENARQMDINENQREILWTLVFAYRDFCNEFGHFERIAQTLIEDLNHSPE